MKLINANIKTLGELVKRLVDGEVFHTSESNRLMFTPDPVNPFHQIIDSTDYPLEWRAIELHSLKVEAHWYEYITDPVICWGWDDDHEDKTLALIGSYAAESTYKFIADKECFINAEPVNPEELLQC